MSETGCANCPWRAKFDARPTSFLGRLWRFHANFCPGWRKVMTSLPDQEKRAYIEKYRFPASKFA
jgi:hypothetical protein